MLTVRTLSAGLLVLGLLAAPVLADQVVYTASIPLSTTNWSQTMSIPKFDQAPCTLDSICFELLGHVEGTAKFESLDAAPTTVTMNLAATIKLNRPNNTPLVTCIPLVQTIDNVTAFDGVIDFGGTSGKTYTGLSGNDTESACVSSPADIALFTGPGNILLPTTAVGSSSGSGAGNLILQFATSASAGVQVTYFYHCPTATEQTTWGSVKQLFR
jgi:hypothetical protein